MSTGNKVNKVGEKISETATAAKDATVQACSDAKEYAIETKDSLAEKAGNAKEQIKEDFQDAKKNTKEWAAEKKAPKDDVVVVDGPATVEVIKK